MTNFETFKENVSKYLLTNGIEICFLESLLIPLYINY